MSKEDAFVAGFGLGFAIACFAFYFGAFHV